MNSNGKVTKKKLTLWLPESTIDKCKMLALQMRIPVSHLIEGLIEGAQIVPGKNQ